MRLVRSNLLNNNTILGESLRPSSLPTNLIAADSMNTSRKMRNISAS